MTAHWQVSADIYPCQDRQGFRNNPTCFEQQKQLNNAIISNTECLLRAMHDVNNLCPPLSASRRFAHARDHNGTIARFSDENDL
jgi:hypothetical protein